MDGQLHACIFYPCERFNLITNATSNSSLKFFDKEFINHKPLHVNNISYLTHLHVVSIENPRIKVEEDTPYFYETLFNISKEELRDDGAVIFRLKVLKDVFDLFQNSKMETIFLLQDPLEFKKFFSFIEFNKNDESQDLIINLEYMLKYFESQETGKLINGLKNIEEISRSIDKDLEIISVHGISRLSEYYGEEGENFLRLIKVDEINN